MTIATQKGYREPRAREFQAAAMDLQGAVVNQDFLPIIGDYQRAEATFWDLIPTSNKRKAPSDIIQELRKNSYPRVAPASRDTLDSTALGVQSRNTQQSLARDFSDAGQQVKCVYGDVDASYYERSLQQQQGNIWENTFAENSDDLFKAAIRCREQMLFVGDATLNPLEYNGLANLAYAGNQHYLDLRGNEPPDIHKKLIQISIGVSTEPNENHEMSHIFTSGTGQWRMIEEVSGLQIYNDQTEITPGIAVPAVRVAGSRSGVLPIVPTRYLPDEVNAIDPDPEGNGDLVDLVHYYIVDMETIRWYGVVPYDGDDHLDYQVFDLVANTIHNPSLLMRRFILQFGCLFALNGGRGIHRLTIKLEPNTSFSRRTTAITLP